MPRTLLMSPKGKLQVGNTSIARPPLLAAGAGRVPSATSVRTQIARPSGLSPVQRSTLLAAAFVHVILFSHGKVVLSALIELSASLTHREALSKSTL